jgi:ABC-type Mn2+/Zn2+ transport system ATPase subunit
VPRIKHVVTTRYTPTFRSQKVAGLFDIPVEEKLTKQWDIDVPIEEKPWKIGLIVGASGSGKTTIAKQLFDQKYYHSGHQWGASNLLDDFNKELDIKNITDALSHVGFSSPPAWLLPYTVLSNGQKFRADIARSLLEQKDLIVFDEFTSVVDRVVAKIASYAVNKYIRKHTTQFVAVTCHYDVEEWLQPDWVLDLSTNEFKWGCLRRPEITVKIQQCHRSAWQLFKGHHYLSADINNSSTCFIATINEEPVAFCAILSFMHPNLKNCWKEHRTVVLPDYQGIGMGNKLSESIGDWLEMKGKHFISTTSHPAMIGHRCKSSKWALTRAPSHVGHSRLVSEHTKSGSKKRLTASFRYLPQLSTYTL